MLIQIILVKLRMYVTEKCPQKIKNFPVSFPDKTPLKLKEMPKKF